MPRSLSLAVGIFMSAALFGTGCATVPPQEGAIPITGSSTTAALATPESEMNTTLPTTLAPATVTLANGKKIELSIPEGYSLHLASEGDKRVRFLAKSPDNRLFVAEMLSPNDGNQGRVFVYDQLDAKTRALTGKHVYLTGLRNPNSVAFYTDKTGQAWIYIALTDKLIRYPYTSGDVAPTAPVQVITTFPDYGRDWNHGGWHLTRTLAFHENRLYVSVGSSCNSCEEKSSEPSRASILEMNPDGTEAHVYATGLRNAVGIQFIGDSLYATNNGPDHLGADRPEDTFLRIKEGANYGWPYCYQLQGKMLADTSQSWERPVDCATVPTAFVGLPPHSAPLGLEFFQGQFLIALHGSGKKDIGTGYKIIAVSQTGRQTDVVTGFLKDGTVMARPVDILANDDHSFFVTDDYNGAIYLISK